MPTPTDLREQSRLFRQRAESEPTLVLKRSLTSHALALDYLAEKIECEETERAQSAV